MAVDVSPQIQQIMHRLDHLLLEIVTLRQEVQALTQPTADTGSVAQADYFGMWANRDDLGNQSSREWLENLRAQQWKRA